MITLKKVKIYTLCALLGLQSIVFINAGFFDKTSRAIIGGAEGPTPIFITEPGRDSLVENLLEALKDEQQRRTELENQLEAARSDREREELAEKARLEAEQTSPEDEQARFEAEQKGILILVNKKNHVDSDYKPNDLEAIRYFASNRSEASRYMRAEAALHFHELVEAASEEGYELVMTTAYRSYSFQEILWNNYVASEGLEAASRFSAKPGQSEHQTGLAVDVTSPVVNYELSYTFGETQEGIWLSENAHLYGFIIRYPKDKEDITGYLYEPWHLRYVGIAVATEMYNKGLTLEEYLQ